MNALNAYNKLNTNVAGLKKSSEKLSSGYRINRAGDDAAGLAISEKMRSQIRGLNQAKRNSQDGISMIQTFEGATQESHSILQRMKELASESANGTYQDEVDRDAIQLEFNQLNDELDQIADTDFNGVVMLNGGQMADGTKAVDGKFDYVNSTRDPKQLSAADVNTINNNMYKGDTASADEVWAALGAGASDTSIDLTFKYNAKDDTWTVSDASSATILANAKTAVGTNGVTAANNGGFDIKIDGVTKDPIGAVVVDKAKLVDGDTVTVTFTKPKATNAIPDQIEMAKDSLTQTGDKFTNATTIAVATGYTDATLTKAGADAFNGLNGLNVSFESTTDDQVNKITLSKGSANLEIDTTTAGDHTLTLDDGTTYTITTAANNAGTFTIKDKDGKELVTITQAGNGATAASSTKESFKLALDTVKYSDTDKPDLVLKSGDDSSVSKANSNGKATASLTYSDHMVLQTGSRTKDSVDFTFNYATNGMGDLKSNLDLSSRANGLNTKNLSLATQESANTAIDKIDNAINKVSMVRATFGATQNRLEHKIENLTTNTENLTEAESTIRDTDMASEMLNYTKYNVLQQAAQSMLAQANQQPQSILQLLG